MSEIIAGATLTSILTHSRRSTMSTTRKNLLMSLLLPAAILMGANATQAEQPQQVQPQQGMMGPGMMGNPMMGGMMGPSMMGQGMMGMMSGPMVQGRLAYLKAELGITEAQSAAWSEYVSAVNARMSGMLSMHQSMLQVMQSGSATARMDAHINAMDP
jgi:hypothetical protein